MQFRRKGLKYFEKDIDRCKPFGDECDCVQVALLVGWPLKGYISIKTHPTGKA